MSQREPTIEVCELAAGYGRGTTIAGISFAAARGDIVALFGGTGSGKTTLLRLVAGALAPASGTVQILGRSPRAVRKRMGIAQECPRFAGMLTANQTLAAALMRASVPSSQRGACAAEALALADLYSDRDRPVRELSGGQRAALGIARAMAHRPAVLLLDNATSALPDTMRERLWDALREHCRKDGLVVLYATTSSQEAEAAERVLLMDRGRMLACAPPHALLADLAGDTVTVEALDTSLVRRTLRGIFDVAIEESPGCVRFRAIDGVAAVSQLLRHPTETVRAIYIRKPTLWDAIGNLRK